MGSQGDTVRARPRVTQVEDSAVLCPACAKVLEGEPNFCNACGSDLRGLGGSSDTLSGTQKEQILDGRYRLIEKLGEGGMGSVFKVEHVRMGKIAALKVMRPDAAVDKGLKARFLQESRVVAKLSHPNTVQVFDAGELEDGSLFMAMEYVPGKDLSWHLRAHGPMSEEKALSIGVQVLASLAEAHEAGIIHRDIKPANVMLVRQRKGGDDQVKLLDFGIAKLAEGDNRNSTTGEFVGTPAYMSPEQVRGEEVDARSDLYSFGALLFELLSGRQLYTGPTAVSIIKQHLEKPIPTLAEAAPEVMVSPAFEKVLTTALAKDRNDRYPDAETMKKALEALRTTTTRATGDYTPMPEVLAARMLSREDFERFERKLRLQRTFAPIAAGLVVVALSVGGWAGVRHRAATAGPPRVEVEPNDQPLAASPMSLGTPISGTMGASAEGEGDRDLFVAQVPQSGPYRVTLSAVPDLNLTLEVLQLERVGEAEKLKRRLFLDDVGPSEGERVDGLQLAAGPVYLRVEEQPFCTEPNRPSREKTLVPYVLSVDSAPPGDELLEQEPNDTALTAQPLPLTRALRATAGGRLNDVDQLLARRPEASFSAVDYFRVDAVPAADSVAVAVVPPERGALHVIDEAALEAYRLKKSQASPGRPAPAPPAPTLVKGRPAVLKLEPGPDGVRRFRVVPTENTIPGSSFSIAVGTSGSNGLSGLVDLARVLEANPTARSDLVEAVSSALPSSKELSRLTSR